MCILQSCTDIKHILTRIRISYGNGETCIVGFVNV